MILTFWAGTIRLIELAFLSGKETCQRSRVERRNQRIGFVYDKFEMSIRNPIGIFNTEVWHSDRRIQA